MPKPRYWLIKSEPATYSYQQLVKEGRTTWSGIRNYQARNHLRQMRPGDLALYYHTGKEKAVVGVAKVVSQPGPDPTAPKEDWSAVDIVPKAALVQPVPLAQLKSTPALKQFALLEQGRLSVAPVSPQELQCILTLGKTRLR
ncbi:MAG: EVE domain-containing protein [Myxococcota bacterium]